MIGKLLSCIRKPHTAASHAACVLNVPCTATGVWLRAMLKYRCAILSYQTICTSPHSCRQHTRQGIHSQKHSNPAVCSSFHCCYCSVCTRRRPCDLLVRVAAPFWTLRLPHLLFACRCWDGERGVIMCVVCDIDHSWAKLFWHVHQAQST